MALTAAQAAADAAKEGGFLVIGSEQVSDREHDMIARIAKVMWRARSRCIRRGDRVQVRAGLRVRVGHWPRLRLELEPPVAWE